MRLVLDTNVLIAAVVADGLCRNLVRKRVQAHSLFTSAPLFAELIEKLESKFSVNPADVPLVAAYRDRALSLEPAPLPKPICRDPDDDIVIATAVAAKADAIITGDNDLLALKRYKRIAILSPRQFLERIDAKNKKPLKRAGPK